MAGNHTRGGSNLAPPVIPEVNEDSRSHTSSDDIPDIDLDNPVNFEPRKPYQSPRSPVIDEDLQKETISLVINTLTEATMNPDLTDGDEVNNNVNVSK